MNAVVMPLRPSDATARPLPRSLELEQEFLGTLLYRSDLCVGAMALLQQDYFVEELHRRIFDVARDLLAQGKVATPLTVLPFLGEREIAPGLNTLGYLARMMADISGPSYVLDTARAIRDLAIRRGLIAAAAEISEMAHDPPASLPPSRIAADGIDKLHAVVASSTSDGTRHEAHELAASVLDRARRIKSGELKDEGISTGFRGIDVLTRGYRPGTLWVLGARPGVGKTVFFVTSAVKVARRGSGVLGFSLEVPEEQITARILADMAYDPRRPIAFSQIMSGDLDDTDLWCLDDMQKRLATMPLAIDVASRLTVSEIRARIHAERERMAKAGIRLSVVFIDYLKFVQATDRYHGQRVYEVGEISAGLKQIAKDEKLCVVLLAQLNRALEARDDKRPGLSDLRESGDLEADADVVAFLHREAYHIEKSSAFRRQDDDAVSRLANCKHDAEVILGKNRAGPTNVVHLWCDVSASTMSGHAPGEV